MLSIQYFVMLVIVMLSLMLSNGVTILLSQLKLHDEITLLRHSKVRVLNQAISAAKGKRGKRVVDILTRNGQPPVTAAAAPIPGNVAMRCAWYRVLLDADGRASFCADAGSC